MPISSVHPSAPAGGVLVDDIGVSVTIYLSLFCFWGLGVSMLMRSIHVILSRGVDESYLICFVCGDTRGFDFVDLSTFCSM